MVRAPPSQAGAWPRLRCRRGSRGAVPAESDAGPRAVRASRSRSPSTAAWLCSTSLVAVSSVTGLVRLSFRSRSRVAAGSASREFDQVSATEFGEPLWPMAVPAAQLRGRRDVLPPTRRGRRQPWSNPVATPGRPEPECRHRVNDRRRLGGATRRAGLGRRFLAHRQQARPRRELSSSMLAPCALRGQVSGQHLPPVARLPLPGNPRVNRTVAPLSPRVGVVLVGAAEYRQVAAVHLTGGGTCAAPDRSASLM